MFPKAMRQSKPDGFKAVFVQLEPATHRGKLVQAMKGDPERTVDPSELQRTGVDVGLTFRFLVRVQIVFE